MRACKKRDYAKRKAAIIAQQKAYKKSLSQSEKERRRVVANIAKRVWHRRNKERVRAYARNNYRRTYHKWSFERKLKHFFRCRIGAAIRRGGALCDGRALTLLGCGMAHLHRHLEQRFTPEMSWYNYGKYWHVDHYIPCSFFDLNREDERLACFNFANLRPLEARANIIKNDRLPDPGQ